MSTSRDSASDPTPTNPPGPDPAVIRIPGTAYVAVIALAAMLSLPALAWPVYWGWLVIIPIALAWWVARVRTTVTPIEIQARTATGSSVIPWSRVKSVYFPRPRLFGISWARAVLTDGSRVPLPAVNWQQIPELSRASGGRFPDVTALPHADTAGSAE